MNNIKISPSILSGRFEALGESVKDATKWGADYIHCDVMDGRFVPNITFGMPMVKALRKCTHIPLDVHLMITDPERYTARFVEAGADIVTFHYEATMDIRGCIASIRGAGAKVGISIKPATSPEVLRDILPSVDLVLVMSVEPGFGGQSFMPAAVDKVRMLDKMKREAGLDTIIEVDGGISAANSRLLFDAGAEALVAGSSVFGAADPAEAIDRMLKA